MLPSLQALAWPPPSFEFSPNQQAWPVHDDTLRKMYTRWWANVHAGAHSPEGCFYQKWRYVKAYVVEPLRATTLALLVCKAAYNIRTLRYTRMRIAALVSSFLEFKGCGKLNKPFQVAVSSLDLCVDSMTTLGDRTPLTTWVPRRAGVCRLKYKTKAHARRIVFIVGAITSWNQIEMTASLEQNKCFAHKAYHVHRSFCFARRSSGKSSCCERWVGILKYLYKTHIGQSTTTLVQCARLRAAGVRADGSDDKFIRDVATSLHPERMRNTTTLANHLNRTRARAPADKLSVLIDQGDVLNAAPNKSTDIPHGRRFRPHVRAVRSLYEPRQLPDDDTAFLKKSSRSGVATMPLLASTRAQWEHDLTLTHRDRERTDRAAAWRKVKHASDCIPVPCEVGHSSSSDVTSDTDATDDATDDADAATVYIASGCHAAGRALERGLERASSSGSAPTYCMSVAGNAGTVATEELTETYSQLAWVCLKIGGKIHLRASCPDDVHQPCCNSRFFWQGLRGVGPSFSSEVAFKPHLTKHVKREFASTKTLHAM
jgi:hypothetical protein